MAEPLVLLPGMMCDSRLFGPQIKAFGATRAIHLPPITGHDTVEELAAEALAGAPDRFALAGLSMGGIIAMEMLRQAPNRISRIALMDTNPHTENPKKAAEREPQIAKVLAGRLEDVIRDEMKPNYLAPGVGRQPVLDIVMTMALDLGEGVFVRQSRALQKRPDQQAVLRRSKIPTLVLCGEFDELCPVSRHEVMAELIVGSKLVVVPDAGHLPTLEQPESVNAAFKTWLAEED